MGRVIELKGRNKIFVIAFVIMVVICFDVLALVWEGSVVNYSVEVVDATHMETGRRNITEVLGIFVAATLIILLISLFVAVVCYACAKECGV